MKNLIRNSIILVAITIVAGAALGLVYTQTKDRMALSEEKKQKKAYAQLFAAADEFTPFDGFDGFLEAKPYSATIEDVMEAKGGGQTLGVIIKVTSHEGYGGDITFLVGIGPDGTLNGIALLNIAETPGFGMEADAVLVPQYANRLADEFVITKTGEAGEDKINAITGATITSEAINEGVNAALYCYRNL